MRRILILGAKGQVGTELVQALSQSASVDELFPSDVKEIEADDHPNYLKIDVTSYAEIRQAVVVHGITEIHLMAAMLSATAEKTPLKAWRLNMDGLLNVLELAKDGLIEKVFWPSSIAVFGQASVKDRTPQTEVMQPGTVYGISKVSGELWCQYYHDKYGIDVRSVRYPGLIGSKSMPGGGTTDYAVHIFYDALEKGTYTCFLREDRTLPMMHMDDAMRATIEIMEAPAESIKVRTSYNIAGMSFDPRTLSVAIQEYIPDFKMHYEVDHRDDIASSWPHSIDDSEARDDWGWNPVHDLPSLVKDMLRSIKIKSTS